MAGTSAGPVGGAGGGGGGGGGAVDRRVGEDDFEVTEEWIQSWKAKLPLKTIMRLLQVRTSSMFG